MQTSMCLGAPWNWFKPSSKIFLAVLLSWIVCVISVCFRRICLLMPCGHLLGKGWPLGSRLWCQVVKLSLSHWYPGSGVSIPDLCPLSYFYSVDVISNFYIWVCFQQKVQVVHAVWSLFDGRSIGRKWDFDQTVLMCRCDTNIPVCTISTLYSPN